jgi:hypothetical protein
VVDERGERRRRVLALHGEDHDVARTQLDGVDPVGHGHRQRHRSRRIVDGETPVADGVVVGAARHEDHVVAVPVGVLEQPAADHPADGARTEDDDPHEPGAIDNPKADSKRR